MSIRQTICYVAECDECGDDFYRHLDGYEGVPHYDTEAEALARIVECGDDCAPERLHRHGDRVLCVMHAHIEDCARDGHRWSAWYRPYNGRQMRSCGHCHEAETRPVEQGQASG